MNINMYQTTSKPRGLQTHPTQTINIRRIRQTDICEEIAVNDVTVMSVNPVKLQELNDQCRSLAEAYQSLDRNFHRMIDFINEQQDRIEHLEGLVNKLSEQTSSWGTRDYD